MANYICTVDGQERMTFSGDFAQASSPLLIDGNSTPFQVADARHSPARAADLLNDWCRSEGGEAWGQNESVEVEKID